MSRARQRRARVRAMPILIVTLAGFAAIKIAGLTVSGGYMLLPISPATAQDQLDPPGQLRQDRLLQKDGAIIAAQSDEADDKARRIELGEPAPLVSESERALLLSLRERRETLDERERALEMREQLFKAAEKRLEAKLAELKELESRIETSLAAREQAESEQFAGLVKMYETMKPKKAARIFDRLELPVLIGLAERMKPALLGDVLAAMDPGVAERLTTELARLSRLPAIEPADELEPVVAQ